MLVRALVILSLLCTLSCGAEPRRRRHRPPPGDELPIASASARPVESTVPVDACSESGEGMDAWLVSFGRYAVEHGVSETTARSALDRVWWDPEVIDLDRAQKSAPPIPDDVFLATHVTRERIARGKAKRKALAEPLARMETQYGVQPEILVAIWGLETDFGQNIGARSSVRSLATLAFDCRRAARFRAELLSALRILDRGDVLADEMYGGWAGEIGQTQFMPSSYEQFAVDFDGDGRADLLRTSVDALASTANYLAKHGWTARGDYRPGTANFGVIAKWNASDRWDRTIAAFATKLALP